MLVPSYRAHVSEASGHVSNSPGPVSKVSTHVPNSSGRVFNSPGRVSMRLAHVPSGSRHVWRVRIHVGKHFGFESRDLNLQFNVEHQEDFPFLVICSMASHIFSGTISNALNWLAPFCHCPPSITMVSPVM